MYFFFVIIFAVSVLDRYRFSICLFRPFWIPKYNEYCTDFSTCSCWFAAHSDGALILFHKKKRFSPTHVHTRPRMFSNRCAYCIDAHFVMTYVCTRYLGCKNTVRFIGYDRSEYVESRDKMQLVWTTSLKWLFRPVKLLWTDSSLFFLFTVNRRRFQSFER